MQRLAHVRQWRGAADTGRVDGRCFGRCIHFNLRGLKLIGHGELFLLYIIKRFRVFFHRATAW